MIIGTINAEPVEHPTLSQLRVSASNRIANNLGRKTTRANLNQLVLRAPSCRIFSL